MGRKSFAISPPRNFDRQAHTKTTAMLPQRAAFTMQPMPITRNAGIQNQTVAARQNSPHNQYRRWRIPEEPGGDMQCSFPLHILSCSNLSCGRRPLRPCDLCQIKRFFPFWFLLPYKTDKTMQLSSSIHESLSLARRFYSSRCLYLQGAHIGYGGSRVGHLRTISHFEQAV